MIGEHGARACCASVHPEGRDSVRSLYCGVCKVLVGGCAVGSAWQGLCGLVTAWWKVGGGCDCLGPALALLGPEGCSSEAPCKVYGMGAGGWVRRGVCSMVTARGLGVGSGIVEGLGWSGQRLQSPSLVLAVSWISFSPGGGSDWSRCFFFFIMPGLGAVSCGSSWEGALGPTIPVVSW